MMDVGGLFSDFGAILTESVSAQVCRSLFEAHKLLFSFLMTIKKLSTTISLAGPRMSRMSRVSIASAISTSEFGMLGGTFFLSLLTMACACNN